MKNGKIVADGQPTQILKTNFQSTNGDHSCDNMAEETQGRNP